MASSAAGDTIKWNGHPSNNGVHAKDDTDAKTIATRSRSAAAKSRGSPFRNSLIGWTLAILIFIVAVQLVIIFELRLFGDELSDDSVNVGLIYSLKKFNPAVSGQKGSRAYGRALTQNLTNEGQGLHQKFDDFEAPKTNETVKSNWRVVNWADPISDEDESVFSCEWSSFSSSSGRMASFCGGHRHAKCTNGKFFSDIMYRKQSDGMLFYVEIGAQHGACILEMLFETNAEIMAFEPHPKNIYIIRKTISVGDPKLQKRLTLFPLGLSDERQEEIISYHAKNTTFQLPIYAERLDSVMDKKMIPPNSKVFINMDVQGFECKILEGISDELAEKIDMIKLKWMDHGQCGDGKNYLQKLNKLGFDILWRNYSSHEKHGLYLLPPGQTPNFNVDIIATRKNDRDAKLLMSSREVVRVVSQDPQNDTNNEARPISLEVVNWADPISAEEESMFNCEWSVFNSTSGEEVSICDSSVTKTSKCAHGKYFTDVWYRGRGEEKPYYVDIGAQHGACILDMLLETNASILAFEPHPKNIFSIRKTISLLDKTLQDRVKLFPIALSDESKKENISYHPTRTGPNAQLFIHTERLDSALDVSKMSANTKILVNMQVQGSECKILKGMGDKMPNKIEVMKLKWETASDQPCMGDKDYLQTLRSKFGFDIWRQYWKGKYSMYLLPYNKPVFSGVDLFATRM